MSSPSAFRGFPRNRYTPVPDRVFDELLAELTNEELRVLLYVIRRTEGFKRDTDAIAIDQFAAGITKRDGARLDGGTGLSRAAVYRGIAGLVKRGILLKVAQRGPSGARRPNLYAIPFEDDDDTTSHRREVVNLAGENNYLSPADPQETVILQDTATGDLRGEPAALWAAVLAAIQQTKMTDANFTTWWAGTVGREIDGAALVVQAPNKFTGEWLQTRCRPLARKMLRQIAPALTDVRFVPRS